MIKLETFFELDGMMMTLTVDLLRIRILLLLVVHASKIVSLSTTGIVTTATTLPMRIIL